MGRFDLTKLRYISPEEWRILTGTEMGMKNHEVVPMSMVASLSNLKRGGARKMMESLSSDRFICWEKAKRGKITGYRLTWAGYDHLSFRALCSRGVIHSVGKQIGVGKESDVYIAMGRDLAELERLKDLERLNDIDLDGDEDENENQSVNTFNNSSSSNRRGKDKEFTLSKEELESEDNLRTIAVKIHRLGRTSFRNVKNLRDYSNANHTSWIYLSRLAATREYSFQKVLFDRGFPVPKPLGLNRHIVAMELVRGHPLNKIDNLNGFEHDLLEQLLDVCVKLIKNGIVHGDLNEFNIMIEDADENGEPLEVPRALMIDFPQMVSVDHPDAEKMFNRDVNGILRFFEDKFDCEVDEEDRPDFRQILEEQRKYEEEMEKKMKEQAENSSKTDDILNWKMDLMDAARKLGNNMQGGWAALPQAEREDNQNDQSDESESSNEEENQEVDGEGESESTVQEAEKHSVVKSEDLDADQDQISDLPSTNISLEYQNRINEIRTGLSAITGSTSVPPEQIKFKVKKAMELSKYRSNVQKLRKGDKVSVRKRQAMNNDIKATLHGGTKDFI